MKLTSEHFLENARTAMQNSDLRARMDFFGVALPAVRNNAVEQLGNFDELRAHLKKIRDHSLDNLDHYLRQYEEQVVRNGGQVHWARDGDELNDIVAKICQRVEARQIGKGKSMITEETGLTAHLESKGMQVTETDLGEYIVQVAGEVPSHIVGPAFHKSEEEIRQLFYSVHDLGERELADPPAMVQEARQILRERFLQADVGIIGANALIAENGRSVLVTNEGNGDLVSTLPKVQIVCTSFDRVLPRADDASALLRLLARSAIGTVSTAYTSFYSGPKRSDDSDGPEEFHVVLLDNRRSEIIGSNYQDMLGCLRCGACLNHCPIYISAGGHAYGSVYGGPMGSVLTPLLTSLEESNSLPNACTTCGRCAEVCPASIPLPDLLRDLRTEERDKKLSPRSWRWGLKFHGLLARSPTFYQLLSGIAIRLMNFVARRRGHLHSLMVNNGWTAVRDFPAPQRGTFMSQWKRQLKRGEQADE